MRDWQVSLAMAAEGAMQQIMRALLALWGLSESCSSRVSLLSRYGMRESPWFSPSITYHDTETAKRRSGTQSKEKA